MTPAYIYQSPGNIVSSTAIIILPDIFIFTDYAKSTADNFSKIFNMPTFMLNYFYEKSGGLSHFDQSQGSVASSFMTSDIGLGFEEFFNKSVNEITSDNKAIKNIIVVGFCFGGRLTYLAGLDQRVSKIIAFYGAGANDTAFCNGQSVADLLAATRSGDASLKVLAFYGTEDGSIPASDRQLTAEKLSAAGIDYQAKEYAAGHAYFQEGRASYDKTAADASVADIQIFLS